MELIFNPSKEEMIKAGILLTKYLNFKIHKPISSQLIIIMFILPITTILLFITTRPMPIYSLFGIIVICSSFVFMIIYIIRIDQSIIKFQSTLVEQIEDRKIKISFEEDKIITETYCSKSIINKIVALDLYETEKYIYILFHGFKNIIIYKSNIDHKQKEFIINYFKK